MNCNGNKHLFLLTNEQKLTNKYFENLIQKPYCLNCSKNINVIKIIHSNNSNSINKLSILTKDVKVIVNECSKNKKWFCKTCKHYF